MPLPGELRTLAVDPSETIAWLAVDSHNDLCALVSARHFPHAELRYGCFDAAGTFVARATIATGDAEVHDLTLDRDDNPSMIVRNFNPAAEFVIDGRTHSDASCAVRLAGGAIWSSCIVQPSRINSFAYNDRTDDVASIIRNGLDGMIGPFRVTTGGYLASSLPIVQRAQLQLFAASDNGPRFIVQDEDGGWWVAGDYASPTPSAWMLPEALQARLFWAKVDADFNPIEVHTYAENAITLSWNLDAEGRPIALAFTNTDTGESISIYVVGVGFESLVPVGRGGYGSAVSASANTVAAMLQFFQGPLEVGAQRFELDPMTQVLATFTRSGELLTARQVPGSWATNLVILDDESIAYAEYNLVHVLSSR